ncbi:MAG: flagellar hook-basal body complex protein FliE [Parvularculaceae bacterium]|nr:flagellar hook-basal body complex protein FliE [Parvularculaceae bacterium]
MKIAPYNATHAYGAARKALGAPADAAGGNKPTTANSPAAAAFDAVHELTRTVAKGESASIAYMTGSADPHSVVEALAAAELAVETAVTVRNKVVEAYQELLRMPV